MVERLQAHLVALARCSARTWIGLGETNQALDQRENTLLNQPSSHPLRFLYQSS